MILYQGDKPVSSENFFRRETGRINGEDEETQKTLRSTIFENGEGDDVQMS